MSVCIQGIGLALPANWIRQADAAELTSHFSTRGDDGLRMLKALFRKTGIRKRHSVLLECPEESVRQSFFPAALNGERGPGTAERMAQYEAHIGGIAFESAQQALYESRVEADTITHLVTASCSGFSAPGMDCELISRLNMSKDVRRVHIGFMGCHAALNALAVAGAFCEADHRAHVLVCCAELCSLHMQYGWERNWVMGNSLFADGAASAIVSSQDGSDSTQWKIRATGSAILDNTRDAIQWRIGNNGFEMHLSPDVPNLVKTHLRKYLENFLHEHDLRLEDIKSWAIHPGGPKVIQSVQESIQLHDADIAVSQGVLADCGNMSSPTLLFIMRRLMDQNAPRPCVALGFGPGMAIEATVFD